MRHSPYGVKIFCFVLLTAAAFVSEIALAETSAKFPILTRNNQSDKVALIEIDDSREKVSLAPGHGAKELSGISVLWLVKSNEKSIEGKSGQKLTNNNVIRMEGPGSSFPPIELDHNPVAENPAPLNTNQTETLTNFKQETNSENTQDNSNSNAGASGGLFQNYSDSTGSGSNSSSSDNSDSLGDVVIGGGSHSNSPPANQSPVALAGESEISVSFGETVTLNGAGSYDPEGSPLIYAWTQIEGADVLIANANTPLAQFTTPNIPTILVIRLAVYDLSGATSSTNVTVYVNDPGVQFNPPPTIAEGDVLFLPAISEQIRSFSLSAEDENGSLNGLTWTVGLLPENGSVVFDGNLSEHISSSGDVINVHYQSNPGFYGFDSFVIQVYDQQGERDEIFVSVSIQMAIYVDDDGSSQSGYNASNPPGSEHHPYSTFEEGLNHVPSGGILYVQEGTYTWGLNDTIDKLITVEGLGTTKPVLNIPLVFITASGSGSQFKNLELKSTGGFFLAVAAGQNVSNVTLDNIYLSSTANWSGLMTTIDSNSSGANDGWIIRNSTFECMRSEYECLLFNHHSNLLIENNTFRHLNNTVTDVIAVYVGHSRGDIVFRGNVFTDAGGNAIHVENSNYGQAGGDTGRLYIVNNTFHQMRASANSYYTGAIYESQMDEYIVNNLFANNASVAIHRWDSLTGYNAGASWVDYNLYFNNNGTQDNSPDDIANNSPLFPRYTTDSFQNDKGPDVDPQFLSENIFDPSFLKFQNTSEAANGAYNELVPGYQYPILTKEGQAYFGAFESTD